MDNHSKLLPSEGYLFVDVSRCAGCQVCMLVCSLVHEGTCNPELP